MFMCLCYNNLCIVMYYIYIMGLYSVVGICMNVLVLYVYFGK